MSWDIIAGGCRMEVTLENLQSQRFLLCSGFSVILFCAQFMFCKLWGLQDVGRYKYTHIRLHWVILILILRFSSFILHFQTCCFLGLSLFSKSFWLIEVEKKYAKNVKNQEKIQERINDWTSIILLILSSLLTIIVP